MKEEPGSRDLLEAGQALFWGLAFAVVLALVFLFFFYSDQVEPVLGQVEQAAWLLS